MSMTKVVVIGGGFAGLRLVRKLCRDPSTHVTLVSDHTTFRYSPALYRTATGHRRNESIIPIASVVKDYPNVTFIHAKATSIDRQSRTIELSGGQKLHYDYCVIAIGVVTSYFGIPGIEEHAYSIKSGAEVNEFKKHLHDTMTEQNDTDRNYVIVGGGPTGVELASALGAYVTRIAKKHRVPHPKVHIELIEAAPRLLPSMSQRASNLAFKRLKQLRVKVMLSKHVEAENETTLTVAGRSIPTQTVIWTAGVTNNPFFLRNKDQFTLDDKKRVVVDGHLRVDAHTFVIGDNCNAKYAGLAISAVRNANYVAWFLKWNRRGYKTTRFWPFIPISVVPLGQKRAVFQWGKIVFDGYLGGFLRLLGDIVGYGDVMGYRRALRIWLRRNDQEETCPICRAPHSASVATPTAIE